MSADAAPSRTELGESLSFQPLNSARMSFLAAVFRVASSSEATVARPHKPLLLLYGCQPRVAAMLVAPRRVV